MNKFIIGIDVGATNTKIGLIKAWSYKVIYRTVFGTRNYIRRKNILIKTLTSKIESLLQENHLFKNQILAIGLGLPGPIDCHKGIVHFLPNIPGWKEVPIKRILEQRLKIPVFVDNDVNLITLAEWRLGAGSGIRNLLCITLGTGVGGGLILDNKLYRGAHFLAGEIGHMPINETGPLCNCGGFACLERYVGNKYILSAAGKIFKKNNLTLEKLSLLSEKGNNQAIKIWQDVGRRIGVALSGAVNLLNLERIIIGGGVSLAGKPLWLAIRKTVQQRAMPNQARQVKIVRSKLGLDAGILGAAVLTRERF
ncbi:MAG: ROK family protein [Candidatus Omnitrophota bacterium]|nr:ROK family protein [Candidatus Omnitrophota bacterium]